MAEDWKVVISEDPESSSRRGRHLELHTLQAREGGAGTGSHPSEESEHTHPQSRRERDVHPRRVRGSEDQPLAAQVLCGGEGVPSQESERGGVVETFAESISAHLRAQRITSDVLLLPVDVHFEKSFHLLEWCSTQRSVTTQTVKVAELIQNGCPKCCSVHNLDLSFSATGAPSPQRQRLAAILEAAQEMKRYRDQLEERYQKRRHWERDRTPFEEATSAAALVARLRSYEVPGEVREEKERLLLLAPERAQRKIAAVRDPQRLAELERQVRRWYPEGTDCLLGLSNWWRYYMRKQDADALELMVAFSTGHSNPELLLSRVPGWATEFIIDRLGEREELEMAEDVKLETQEEEILAALWPGMPLLEAVETAQTLAR